MTLCCAKDITTLIKQDIIQGLKSFTQIHIEKTYF